MSVDPGATVGMPAEEPAARSPDVRLAHAHVAGGLFSLARAELERLAQDGALDRDALVDLAVARWRTGDPAGAGQAAQAHLAAGGLDTVALVVAAEAAMTDGRTADARRLAESVLARSEDLEPIFAGIPRSRVWRTTGDEESGTDVQGEVDSERGAAERSAERAAAEGTRARAEAATVAAARPSASERGAVDAHQLMALAAGALRRDQGRAAVELALVLRSEPSLAPAVVELLVRQTQSSASRPAAALEIVRGDAYRLIGRRREAEDAYERARSMLEQLEGGGR